MDAMTYRIIRAASDYSLVIAMTPADATPETSEALGARFFRWATWQISNESPRTWVEISQRGVIESFSGIADGLGYGTLPTDEFPSVEEITAWVNAQAPTEEERDAMRAELQRSCEEQEIPFSMDED